MKFVKSLPLLAFAATALGDVCAPVENSEKTGYGFIGSEGPVWGATWGEEAATSSALSVSANSGWGSAGTGAWSKDLSTTSSSTVSSSTGAWADWDSSSSTANSVSSSGWATSSNVGFYSINLANVGNGKSSSSSAAGKSKGKSSSIALSHGSVGTATYGLSEASTWGKGPKTTATLPVSSYGKFTAPPTWGSNAFSTASTSSKSSYSKSTSSGSSTVSGGSKPSSNSTSTSTTPSVPYQTSNSTSTNLTEAITYAENHPGCFNTPNSRGCWGKFNIATDYEKSWPNTGRVVKYTLDVQNVTTLSPGGYSKQMLVVNGQFPGPLIEANWGDILELTVKNSLDCNGTSMHWHGFRQLNSNPQDGVNGITECPLAPGDSKVYRFQATQYGTTWYHSHFSAQYGDGVVGPIIIHGPSSGNYDIDLGTIQVSDLYNLTACQEDWFAERTGPPTAANYLLNGQNVNPFDESIGSRPSWSFTPGKKHKLRLINTSLDHVYKIAVDNHTMTVVSTDFVPIVPYQTQIININIGQRYEVIIDADQAVSSYWLRSIPQAACSKNQNDGLGTANGFISYAGASSALPTSTVTAYTDACVDEPAASLVPVVNKTVDATNFAAQASALPVNINRVTIANDTVFRWTLNSQSQVIDWSNPTIAQVVGGNDTFPAVKDVITLSTESVWTFWIIQNQFFVPHPMHLHGHDFSLLGQGLGTFDPSNATMVASLNFNNPPRRDVAILLASGWTVIAFETDNPGAWLMHCHIAWHVGEGLSLQFLELPDQVATDFNSTVTGTQFQDTCANWSTFAGSSDATFQQSDSGLKRRTDTMGAMMDAKNHAHLGTHRRSNVLRHAKREEFR